MSNDTKRYQDRQKFIAEAARSKESEQPLVTGDLATQRAIHDSCNGKEQPTPRTDEHCALIGDQEMCHASFARQLERELAEQVKIAHHLAANQIGLRPAVDAIGEVAGHSISGSPVVRWFDGGLRPVGMKLYRISPVDRTSDQ